MTEKKVFKLLYNYIQAKLSCVSEFSCDFRTSYNSILKEILDYKTMFTDKKILQELDNIIAEFKRDYIDFWGSEEE